jgi:hypothetical protein
MPGAPASRDGSRMKKRVASTILWFYASWYATQMAAYFLGFEGAGDVVGPIVGVAVGLLIAVDPRRILWARRVTAKAEGRVSIPTGA